MKELTDAQKVEYFRKSYTSVDGLWFLKVEDLRGFEEALEIDRQVWSIFPKIQARTLRSMLGAERGVESLARCIAAKHSIEGFEFEAEVGGDGILRLVVSKCPWHELMAKSGRMALSERVGSVICNSEYSTWAAEFSDEDTRIDFCLLSQICKGDRVCTFAFEETEGASDVREPEARKTGLKGEGQGRK
jgi:hypothetical protein